MHAHVNTAISPPSCYKADSSDPNDSSPTQTTQHVHLPSILLNYTAAAAVGTPGQDWLVHRDQNPIGQ